MDNVVDMRGEKIKAEQGMFQTEPRTDAVSLLDLWSFLQQTTRVLLVEDDPMTRHLVRKCLKGACMFATASTAHNAMDLCESYQPDVVFLDLGLPDCSGSVVLDWLKLNSPETSVVLFTNTSDYTFVSSLMKSGATGYIAKPFSRDDFIRYINNEKIF